MTADHSRPASRAIRCNWPAPAKATTTSNNDGSPPADEGRSQVRSPMTDPSLSPRTRAPSRTHIDGRQSHAPSGWGLPTRLLAALAMLVALAASACSTPTAPPAGTHTTSPSTNAVTGPAFATLPGHRVSYACTHLPRTASGAPTVVLLTGLDNEMTVWEPTRRELDVTPVCTYDRANLGRSDPVAGPRPISAREPARARVRHGVGILSRVSSRVNRRRRLALLDARKDSG